METISSSSGSKLGYWRIKKNSSFNVQNTDMHTVHTQTTAYPYYNFQVEGNWSGKQMSSLGGQQWQKEGWRKHCLRRADQLHNSWAQCKMKLWSALLKQYWEFQDRDSRASREARGPSEYGFYAPTQLAGCGASLEEGPSVVADMTVWGIHVHSLPPTQRLSISMPVMYRVVVVCCVETFPHD